MSRSHTAGLRLIIILGVMLGIVLVWRAISPRGTSAGSYTPDTLPVLGQVPAFTLTRDDETPFQPTNLRGQIWVADFIFTYCAGPCPLMSTRMAALQAATSRINEVKLISISVDPERDTPAVLRAYGGRYGADPQRWWFLTGSIDTIRDVAVNGFKVGSVEDPLLHSTYFVLVDADGNIRGYFDSAEPEVVERIVSAIERLRREGPPR